MREFIRYTLDFLNNYYIFRILEIVIRNSIFYLQSDKLLDKV